MRDERPNDDCSLSRLLIDWLSALEKWRDTYAPTAASVDIKLEQIVVANLNFLWAPYRPYNHVLFDHQLFSINQINKKNQEKKFSRLKIDARLTFFLLTQYLIQLNWIFPKCHEKYPTNVADLNNGLIIEIKTALFYCCLLIVRLVS